MADTPPSFQALVAPDTTNTLVVPEIFTVDLHIDPADLSTRDDSYILLNQDGTEHQRRHVGDDAVPGDDRLTLVYTGLRHGLRYTLLIDEGREGKHYAFHNVLLEDLIETAIAPDAKGDGPGEQPEPEEYDSLELEKDIPELPLELRERRPSVGWATADRLPTEGVNDPIV